MVNWSKRPWDQIGGQRLSFGVDPLKRRGRTSIGVPSSFPQMGRRRLVTTKRSIALWSLTWDWLSKRRLVTSPPVAIRQNPQRRGTSLLQVLCFGTVAYLLSFSWRHWNSRSDLYHCWKRIQCRKGRTSCWEHSWSLLRLFAKFSR